MAHVNRRQSMVKYIFPNIGIRVFELGEKGHSIKI